MTALTTQTTDKVRAGLKSALGISANDTTRDVELNGYIARANALAEAYLGFPIEPGTFIYEARFPDLRNPTCIPFNRLDVTAVTSVAMNGEILAADEGHWYFDKEAAAIGFRGCRYANYLAITYQAGGNQVSDVLIEALVIFSSALAGKAAMGAAGMPQGVLSSVDVPGLYRATFRDGGYSEGLGGAAIPVEVAGLLDTVRARGV